MPVTDEMMQSALADIARGNSIRQTAAAHGIPETTLRRSWHKAQAESETPTFTNPDMPADELLDHLQRRFERTNQAYKERKWPKVTAPNEVLGMVFVGDPHLGNEGTNYPLLRNHAELMASTPGVRAVNIGDTVDGWGGRLLALYSETENSRPRERTLIKWFLEDSGIPWWIWLDGNHDTMGGINTFTHAITRIPVFDWKAQFEIVFPDWSYRVDARHNFKGSSIWNELHGLLREAMIGEPADLYVAGHHHNYGVMEMERPDNSIAKLLRVRGYKWIDDHSERHGFKQSQKGSSVMVILDPFKKKSTLYSDLEEGCDYLTYRRAQCQ